MSTQTPDRRNLSNLITTNGRDVELSLDMSSIPIKLLDDIPSIIGSITQLTFIGTNKNLKQKKDRNSRANNNQNDISRKIVEILCSSLSEAENLLILSFIGIDFDRQQIQLLGNAITKISPMITDIHFERSNFPEDNFKTFLEELDSNIIQGLQFIQCGISDAQFEIISQFIAKRTERNPGQGLFEFNIEPNFTKQKEVNDLIDASHQGEDYEEEEGMGEYFPEEEGLVEGYIEEEEMRDFEDEPPKAKAPPPSLQQSQKPQKPQKSPKSQAKNAGNQENNKNQESNSPAKQSPAKIDNISFQTIDSDDIEDDDQEHQTDSEKDAEIQQLMEENANLKKYIEILREMPHAIGFGKQNKLVLAVGPGADKYKQRVVKVCKEFKQSVNE